MFTCQKKRFFSNKEYLLGDSAFYMSTVMVPALKKGQNANLSEDQKYFNTNLVKEWIKSEHCIGILKARFQHVQGLRMVISSKCDLAVILQMIMCACILHNLLIDHAIPQDWMEDNTETEDDEELEQHKMRGPISSTSTLNLSCSFSKRSLSLSIFNLSLSTCNHSLSVSALSFSILIVSSCSNIPIFHSSHSDSA